MPENHPRPEITEVEALLRDLKPAPGGLDRDHVLFRAGRASARGPGRLVWPSVSAALGLATVALAVALSARPAPPERVVYVEVVRPAAPPPSPNPERPAGAPGVADGLIPAAAPAEGLTLTRGRPALERQLLRWGLDALPAPAPAPPPGEPVHRILGVTVDTPAAAGPSWLHLFSFEGKGP